MLESVAELLFKVNESPFLPWETIMRLDAEDQGYTDLIPLPERMIPILQRQEQNTEYGDADGGVKIGITKISGNAGQV